MNLLALDIAACTGYARQADADNGPEYGSERFSGAVGSRALAFEDWLIANIVDDAVTHLAIEAPIPAMGNTNMDVQLWLYAANVIVRKIAAGRNLPVAIVHVGTWRSFFTGHARAPRVDQVTGEFLDTANLRRKWIKSATIAECRKRGWDPKDDNAADALGLLDYCRAHIGNGLPTQDLFMEAA